MGNIAGAAALQSTNRNVIPKILPKLVASPAGTFLVYGGFKSGLKIPATQEQAERHLHCLMQHLQEVAHAS